MGVSNHNLRQIKRVEEILSAKAVDLTLSADEVAGLEEAAQASGVDTRGSWENPMA